MRILIVHNTLNDSRSVSGVLRHYAWMASEWRKAGHPTDFLAAKAGWPQLQQLAPEARLLSSDRWFNATQYLAQTWRYFPAYAYRMASAHFTRLPEGYDVVYASTQLIVEVYAALVLARRLNAKLVAKVHHVLASQPGRGGFFDRLFLWSERRTTRWLHQHADLVFCGTELVARDYQNLARQLGLPRKETVQVGYGIDMAAMPDPSQFSKQYDAVILGRLHEHKGVFDIPRFWKAVVEQKPGARLLVIGEGPHRPRTEALVAEAGLQGQVTFTGGIGEAEKNALLCQSRIGISLSYEEGWGLSINEFLAAGLPVVAYELPVFAQVFPGQLDLVPRGDQQAAARQVVQLLNDPVRQREQGGRGRAFVQRYDYRNVAAAELRALASLFHSPP